MTFRHLRTNSASALVIFCALTFLALPISLTAQGQPQNESPRASYQNGVHHPTITSFSVETPDETPAYPSYLLDIPDEHMTFIPFFDWLRPWDKHQTSYLVFDSSRVVKSGNAGAVVLQTSDLVTFTDATDKGYAQQVMSAPVFFTACNPAYDTEFDENYAGPGMAVQDPAPCGKSNHDLRSGKPLPRRS